MSKNNNWIKLNRKILKNKHWLKKPYSKGQAIVDLLLISDFKTGKFSGSLSFFANRYGWSTSKVSKFFKALIDEKFMQKSGNTFGNSNGNTFGNTYVIENYSSYQDKETLLETILETPLEDNKRSNIKEVYIKEIKGDESSYLELWEEWLNYKKQVHKFNYSDIGSKQVLNRLVKESGFKIEIARKMINKAIENNWKGFFKLEEVQNYGNKL